MRVEDVLPLVSKPGRYIGNEWNIIKKDKRNVHVTFGLCFPDVYEVGMSHLGMKILYSILNARADTACERFFAPWIDMEKQMREHGIPLLSLETGTPLNKFDIVGFSLQYELSYTNVLTMLSLGGVPLFSSQRDSTHTLVIAGGPCCFNPEPLADFVDCFVIGEAEEVILELIDAYERCSRGIQKSSSNPGGHNERQNLLRELGRIEGIYVPSLYGIKYDCRGLIKEVRPGSDGVPVKIRRRIIRNLDEAHYPTSPVVPYVEIVHDRIGIEIMRGCPHRCRFCQAGAIYLPCRKRSKHTIKHLALEISKNTGYDEISLVSLSSGDYPEIAGLIKDLAAVFTPQGIAISLPSLRVDSVPDVMPSIIFQTRKTGLTIAPEAGSSRLRRVINKDIDVGRLIEGAKRAYEAGWRRVKLYFMIGLPTETEADLDGIIALAGEVINTAPSRHKRSAGISLSISCFIPKPHTPFQWEAMSTIDELRQRQDYLRNRLKRNRWAKLKFHNPRMSFLEGVFSRGDRRLSGVLVAAWNKGCRFDGWSEQFRFDAWMDAFAECGISPDFYATRRREPGEVLPWDIIDTGLTREFLWNDRNRAFSQTTYSPCSEMKCGECMVCPSYALPGFT
jgi:radical SAM family uncharacterized protein